jgi:hypothetical protein
MSALDPEESIEWDRKDITEFEISKFILDRSKGLTEFIARWVEQV